MYIRCINTESIDGTKYDNYISLGDRFVVHGIMCMQYSKCLIFSDRWPPKWIPLNMFEIVDGRIPPNWFFNNFNWEGRFPDWFLHPVDNNEDWYIIGYEQFVKSVTHYNKVMEREKADLDIFYEEAKKTENWNQATMDFWPLLSEYLREVILGSKNLIKKFNVSDICFTREGAVAITESNKIHNGYYKLNGEYFKYLDNRLIQVVEMIDQTVLFFENDLRVTLYMGNS